MTSLRWFDRLSTVAFAGGATALLTLNGVTLHKDWKDGPDPFYNDKDALARLNRATESGDDVKRQRLVIVGSGWGAVGVLKALKPGRYDITCVSENNYFLFTPLLPSVAVGTLHAASLVEAARNICLRTQASFLQAKVVDIDPTAKTLTVQSTAMGKAGVNEPGPKNEIPYDVLVLAVGSRGMTWGVPGVEEHCNFLKTISDARHARAKIISLFEEASLPHYTDEERRRLLHFVVVGGGPTGVEFAAELMDFIHEDLVQAFPRLSTEIAQVSLIQGADHILNTYDKAISEYAEKRFKLYHINVICHAHVKRVEKDKIVYTGHASTEEKTLDFGMCMWSTGVGPQELISQLSSKIPDFQKNKRAIVTDDHLRVIGADDMFALGDCATIAQPRLMESTLKWFERVDTDHNGSLSFEEFSELAHLLVTRYPQLQVFMSSVRSLFQQFDINKDGRMDLNELKSLFEHTDRTLTALPATAQVASKQGYYLARMLNHVYQHKATDPTNKSTSPSPFHMAVGQFRPFVYHHAGSLAYIGGDRAVIDLGAGLWAGGMGAFYLWRSAYFSEQVSNATRAALFVEWFQRPLLGRNIAKY